MVTGSAGMLGRHIKKVFSLCNIDAVYVDRTIVDLNNGNQLDNFISKNRINVVIHAASNVGNAYTNKKNEYNILHDNINIGTNIIQSCLRNNVNILLNISSACIYPEITDREIKETDLNLCIINDEKWPYSLSKLVITKKIQTIANSHGLAYKSVIPCNLYGEFDNFNINKSHLIPSVYNKISYAVSNFKNNVHMWGDGSVRREVMYADDLVYALILILDNIDKIPDIINIGYGSDYSIEEIYTKIALELDWNGFFIKQKNMYSGTSRRLLCSKIINSLGFYAPTPLEKGIDNIKKNLVK